MDLKTKNAEHAALEALVKSKGWAVIRARMDDEMGAALRSLASPAPMDIADVHFRRGALLAAIQLVAMPDKLLTNLKSEIAFEEALQSRDPAAKAAGMEKF